TEPTDRNMSSTGCGVLYMYWLMSLGHTAAEITQAGCPTGALASNYEVLTGSKTAWSDFSQAVAGLSGSIRSDNPWSAAFASGKKSKSVERPRPGDRPSP